MKKVVVLMMMMAFLVGLAVPALAEPGYHRVYKWDYMSKIWDKTMDCEMFSKESDSGQYRWQSDENAYPCQDTYLPPHPEPPLQFDVYNYAHLFPWIEAEITETRLIWDIFKPGNYMAKTFIVQLKANCDVQVHLGGGTWDIPARFVSEDEAGYQDGHIEFAPFTKEGDDEEIGDKIRQYSLLNKESPGTPPDEIEVRWFWYVTHGDKPPPHEITAEEFEIIPPKDDPKWVPASDLNCTSVTVEDSEDLHKPMNTHLVFFEDLLVEQCDSEGKYLEVFAVTITPDP